MSFLSLVKYLKANFSRFLGIDLFFPPLCHLCNEASPQILCSSCLKLLALPDVHSRCRHCFTALENPCGLCRQCAHSPALSSLHAYLFELSPIAWQLHSLLLREDEGPLKRAIASMLILLWDQLNWPLPDRIIWIRPKQNHQALLEIAEEFAQMIDRPLKHEFRWHWTAPFQWKLIRDCEDLLDNQSILLIDFASSTQLLRDVTNELWPAFPRKIYILSVLGHDH